METIIAQITENEEQNQKIYEQASDILKRGGLVAFPTETVYGLGAQMRLMRRHRLKFMRQREDRPIIR